MKPIESSHENPSTPKQNPVEAPLITLANFEAKKLTPCIIALDQQRWANGINNNIQIWSIEKLQQSLEGHAGEVLCLAMCENLLVSGACEKSIMIWEEKGGRYQKLQHERNAHTDYVTTLIFLSQEYFVSGSNDKNIKIWKRNERRGYTCFQVIVNAHAHAITSLVAYDGGFASSSRDGVIKIWGEGDGFFVCQKELKPGGSPIPSLKVFHHQLLIAQEKNIKIYSKHSNELKTLHHPGAKITSLGNLGIRLK